ncbi:MAG: LytTR family transcriptional regulator [Lachnospiraceae bacterium]|nr:LytTR family transcriptional regulator [Lachnospiraceae bacterium]
MKVDISQIDSGEEQIVLRYLEKTPRIQRIIDAIEYGHRRIPAKIDNETIMINPEEILYIESVDDRVFAYLKTEVVRLEGSLSGVLTDLSDDRFFRCSKSMILNIEKVERLKSMSSNRIDATMEGGEHILISRTYASDFRRVLKGGRGHER